jgi:antirestriction protein ArdC
MLCGAHGVQPSARNDHAAYLSHWVSVLKAEPMVLWSVAGAAQRAADMILDFHDHAMIVTDELAHASVS